MATCSFPDCDRPAAKRTLCLKHYMQWRRGAEIAAPASRPATRPIGYRHLRRDGYIEVKVAAVRNGYRLEHRVLAERMLGRSLTDDEQVHHINGDRSDNRLANLQVLTNVDHQRLHDHLGVMHEPVTVRLVCQLCGVPYLQRPSKSMTSKFCSNACRLTALHQANTKP